MLGLFLLITRYITYIFVFIALKILLNMCISINLNLSKLKEKTVLTMILCYDYNDTGRKRSFTIFFIVLKECIFKLLLLQYKNQN